MNEQILSEGNELYTKIIKITDTINALNAAKDSGANIDMKVYVNGFAPCSHWIPQECITDIINSCEVQRNIYEKQFNDLNT